MLLLSFPARRAPGPRLSYPVSAARIGGRGNRRSVVPAGAVEKRAGYSLRVATELAPVHRLNADPAAFPLNRLDDLDAFYREYGFAILRGALDGNLLARLEAECVDAQERLVAGHLDARHGTVALIEGDAGDKARRFANYVIHITELSPAALAIAHRDDVTELVHRWLGPECWSAESERFGYVYQDARPSAESSYKRIGWHSDWQSGPHLDMWPATAITVHIDPTSPANGFLRVVPGSHRWATPAPYDNVNGAVVPPGGGTLGWARRHAAAGADAAPVRKGARRDRRLRRGGRHPLPRLLSVALGGGGHRPGKPPAARSGQLVRRGRADQLRPRRLRQKRGPLRRSRPDQVAGGKCSGGAGRP